jgi:hypothetical protein
MPKGRLASRHPEERGIGTGVQAPAVSPRTLPGAWPTGIDSEMARTTNDLTTRADTRSHTFNNVIIMLSI